LRRPKLSAIKGSSAPGRRREEGELSTSSAADLFAKKLSQI